MGIVSLDPLCGKAFAKHAQKSFCEAQFTSFADGGIAVSVPAVSAETIVLQTLYPNPNTALIHLCHLLHALKNINHITLVVPYVYFDRQDTAAAFTSCGLDLFVRLLSTFPIQELITCDLHNHHLKEKLPFPLRALSHEMIFRAIHPLYPTDVVVSPDKGSAFRATAIAARHGASIAVLDKYRNGNTLHVSFSNNITCFYQKNCLVVDDCLSTGKTLLETVSFLMKAQAKTIEIWVTHVLAIEKLQDLLAAGVTRIVFSNTVCHDKALVPKHCLCVDVFPLLADKTILS